MMVEHWSENQAKKVESGDWRHGHFVVRRPTDMWQVFARLESELTQFTYPAKDLFAVKLVLAEAIVNAVRHGNKSDPRKRVDVSYVVTADEVVVEVLDEGSGFDPSFPTETHVEQEEPWAAKGGLFLMQALSTWVRFNAHGNGVTICRRRSSQRFS